MGAMDELLTNTINSVLNRLGITPDDIKTKVEEISSTIVAFKNQSDRIERNQAEIIRLLQNLTGDKSYGETAACLDGGESQAANGHQLIDGQGKG